MHTKFLEETRIIESSNWVARVRPPLFPWNGRIVLLLHGWTGDENIMWIFARKIPGNCWIVAPRGPLPCPDGGFAWAIPEEGKRPDIEGYLENGRKLIEELPVIVPDYTPQSRLDIIGFSQGAAMTYAMSVVSQPVKIAPLAGYLPPGFDKSIVELDLSRLQVFIAHNTDDRMVPVEESRRAVSIFKKQRANVIYCENAGGHKVSTSCFNALDDFLFD